MKNRLLLGPLTKGKVIAMGTAVAVVFTALLAFLPMTPSEVKPKANPVSVETRKAPSIRAISQSLPIEFDQGSYVLHIPGGVPPEDGWPWMINYHGASWNGLAHEQQTGMSTVADAYGFVVIYPDGEGGRWDAGFCCASQPHRDDVAWSRAVISDAATRTHLDKSRGYATGGSNGGMMAWRMACEANDIIRSAAVVAGALVTKSCVNKVVRIYRQHGLLDEVVPYCEESASPTGGCQGGGPVSNVVFWSLWKTKLMMGRGSTYTETLYPDLAHTWNVSMSDKVARYFATTGA